MEIQTLSLISPLILISIGIALIALEAVITSFIIIWFGVSSILVGISSYYINYNDGIWQIATIAILALILLFILRTHAMKWFMKAETKDHNDDFFNEEGEGVIQNGQIYYKATYWKIKSENNEVFEEGEKVKVLSTSGSIANVRKIIN